MKKRFIIVLALFFIAINGFAQRDEYNYNIEFTIKGIRNTVIYIGYHLGEKKYVIDTISVDANGHGVMEGNKEIHKGIYIVVLPSQDMNFFEFLMGPEGQRNFSIETNTANYVKNMKIKGSPENVAFNNYQRHMVDLQQERMEIEKAIKKAGDDNAAKEAGYEKMRDLKKRRLEYMAKVEKENKGTLFGSIMRSMHEIDIPDFPRDENGVITDSTFQYRYYKEHYFDYVDFEEEGLVRTPIYESKLNYYFEKMVVPSPDSLIVDAHNVIEMSYEKGLKKGDTLIYQYTLSHLLNYFEESEIKGYDAVFVAIAKDWYLSGKAPWADHEFLSKLKDKVEEIAPALPAPKSLNNTLLQTKNQIISDVDENIPHGKTTSENTYVLIIANEEYEQVDNVNFALHDGEIFKEYCVKTLGVPEEQIRFYPNATFGKIVGGVDWLKYALDNFEGSKGIVFYCGHGIPDEKSGEAFIIPVDGKGTNTTTCYSLNTLYKTLAETKASNITYFMDACFTGTNKEGSMLVAARGVAREPAKATVGGNTVVFSASSGDETAMTYPEKGHGLFTYFLLKKLQETGGDVNYSELSEYINNNVKKKAFLINEKPQTPVTATSPAAQNSWRDMKLK